MDRLKLSSSNPIQWERMMDQAVQICCDLVRINTVNPYSGDRQPGGEAAGQQYIEPILRESGAEIDLFEPPADIYERMGVIGPENRMFDGRPNLVAEWTFGSGKGPRVMILGHMDTVGVDDMTIDPFSGHIENERIWGRGSSDMKGAMGAAVAAAVELARHHQHLDGSVVLMSVVDEECDGIGAGALACMDKGYRADVAISVDGQGPAILRGYAGILTARVTVRGQAGHAAAPIDLNESNAMERAVHIAQKILDYRRARWNEHGMPLNLGIFRSGMHPAVIPAEAVLSVNISYSFKEARAAESSGLAFGGALIRDEFEKLVKHVDHDASIVWVKDGIPFETNVNDPLVKEMSDVFAEVMGNIPRPEVARAWTDASHLSYFGKIPTVVCGASTPGKSHTADENTEVWRVRECARILATYLYAKLAHI